MSRVVSETSKRQALLLSVKSIAVLRFFSSLVERHSWSVVLGCSAGLKTTVCADTGGRVALHEVLEWLFRTWLVG